MAETALVVLIPELEPLIGDWRRRYTGDGGRDMPPHVTLKEMKAYAESVLKGDPNSKHMIAETIKTAMAGLFKKGE